MPPAPALGVPLKEAVPLPLSTKVTPAGKEPVSVRAGAGAPTVETLKLPLWPTLKVAEVALIGVADARYGEAPLAIIAPRDPADPPTTEEIEAFCREHLAAYKRPRDVVIVAALPRNPSGKVLKTALRDEYGAARVVAAPAV